MNRKVLLFCAATVPLFFLVLIFQSFRFEELRRDVMDREKQQQVWIEKNKQMMAGVTVMTSPARIEKLAKEMKLETPSPQKVIKVEFSGKRKSDG